MPGMLQDITAPLIKEKLNPDLFAFFKQIETLFMITAIGTFVSNFKMFYLINRYDNKIKIQWKNFSILKFAPLAFLAILILLFGLHPVFYEKIIPEVLKHSGQELFEGVSPFHHLFNHGLPGFFTIEFIGIMVIYFGLKTGIFHIKLPHIILYSWYHIYQQLEKNHYQETNFLQYPGIGKIRYFEKISAIAKVNQE